MSGLRTHDLAKGKWRGIMMALGFPKDALTGKNSPCPVCGGRDRFRFDNQAGQGSAICSGACGASGNGWKLLEKWKGWDFKTAAAEVDKIIGNVREDPRRLQTSDADKRKRCAELWGASERLEEGGVIHQYLLSRGCPLPTNRDCLRLSRACPVPHEVGHRWAMIARVQGPDGVGVTLHRTYLTPQGRKAPMDNPRALMPGELVEGSAVRLAPHGKRLGIAEGIETALAAGEKFGLPAWAAISAGMLAKWSPPEGVEEVVVFADNDLTFTGQAAAYQLAHRLVLKGLKVTVEIPPRLGTDWADEQAA